MQLGIVVQRRSCNPCKLIAENFTIGKPSIAWRPLLEYLSCYLVIGHGMTDSSTDFLPAYVILVLRDYLQHGPYFVHIWLLPTKCIVGYLQITGLLVPVNHVGNLIHR